MKNFSRTLWILVSISFGLWLLSKGSWDAIMLTPMRSLAQVFAILGATGYFTAFILSSRLPFFEKGIPLDKAYKLHRIVGTWAVAGILLHVTTLMTNLLPSPLALTLYLIPSSNIAYTMGILAFYLLLFNLLVTLYIKLPYHIWKILHRITSYSIIFATLHLLLIPSDISKYPPLAIWMFALAGLGVAAWVYRQFIYPRVAFSHEYTVKNITELGAISIITLTLLRKPLILEPGQFAFFKIFTLDHTIPPETHPFTVLTTDKNELTIGVKRVGDFTKTLQMLRPGTTVKVAGPHGSFGKDIIHSERPQVWIAGGIGITPFFNLATYFAHKKETKNATLYYSTTEQDRLFHPLLLNYTNKVGIAYNYSCSSTSERLNPQRILETLRGEAEDFDFFLCGPKGMLLSFMSALKDCNVPDDQIHTEEFDFKSLEL